MSRRQCLYSSCKLLYKFASCPRAQGTATLQLRIAKSMQTGMPTPRKASGPARRFIELPEAPCFRPTAEEWADPLRYIAAIRQQAEPYGLCRVVPPASWAPPFAIDKEALQFRTLVQRVHELQERADDPGARDSFNGSFAAWQAATGALQKKAPSLGSQEVDLCSLYRAVSRRGGHAAVTEAKAWRDIARVLGVSFALSVHPVAGAWLRSSA